MVDLTADTPASKRDYELRALELVLDASRTLITLDSLIVTALLAYIGALRKLGEGSPLNLAGALALFLAAASLFITLTVILLGITDIRKNRVNVDANFFRLGFLASLLSFGAAVVLAGIFVWQTQQ